MKRLLIFSLLFFALSPVWTQDLDDATHQLVDSLVNEHYREGGPGVALGIVQDGQIVYETYEGLQDLKKEIPVDPQTRFNVASVAKQFTAMCVLYLVQEEKLALEDDFRKYIPEVLKEVNEPITIGHLLTHTSGIRDVHFLWRLQGITWWKHYLKNSDAVELLSGQRQLNFEPGSKYMYSNSNYILLAEVVARASGQSFKDFSDQLFHDMGFASMRFETDSKDIDNMARPYFNFGDWSGYKWKPELVGDGALFGTLRDLMHWEVLLQAGQSNALENKILQLSQAKVPGFEEQKYGFGLDFGEMDGEPYRSHSGSTGAWNSMTLRIPGQDIAVVALSSSGAAYSVGLAQDVAQVMMGTFDTSPVRHPKRPEELGEPIAKDRFPGVYGLNWGLYYRFEEVEGGMILERFGRSDVKLVEEAPNLFHQEDDPDFKQHFSIHPERGLEVTFYYWSHEPYYLTKKELDWGDYDFAQVEGTYSNDETGSEIKVVRTDGDNYELKMKGGNRDGKMIAPDELIVDGFRLHVEREGEEIIEVKLYNSRLQGVEFARVK